MRWSVSEKDLEGVTPQKARDLVTRCFFEAQKETLAEAKKKLGSAPTDTELRENVLRMVKMAFKETGGDFDSPTKDSLMRAIDVLARKAASWGTPPEIINHHKGEIEKILKRL